LVDKPWQLINIGNVAGILLQDTPMHAYDVSRAVVHCLTRKIAANVAPGGITVNAIAPKYILRRLRKRSSAWTKDCIDSNNDLAIEGRG
jgi:NAD(P)-dependent dehydrogenase (short-subunit alcohol dehydrogenase family)